LLNFTADSDLRGGRQFAPPIHFASAQQQLPAVGVRWIIRAIPRAPTSLSGEGNMQSKKQASWRWAMTVGVMVLSTAPAAPGQRKEPKYQGRTLHAWLEQLEDYDAEYRRSAAHAAGEFGSDWERVTPVLAAALADKNLEVRRVALQSLIKIAQAPVPKQAIDQVPMSPAAHAAVPIIASAVKDAELRHVAFLALEKIARASKDLGPAATGAVPVLLKALQEPASPVTCKKPEEVYTRRTAAFTLGLLAALELIQQPQTKASVDGLREALKDCAADVRYNAVLALGWYGPAAKDAFAAVVEVMNDKKNDYYLRKEAYQTLQKIDREAAKKVDRP
jgi:HEAT repeat protein